jgi:hypothetical protein
VSVTVNNNIKHQNNMLKRGTQFVGTTMALANQVQSRYDKLGSPWTQNVRNPLPMPQLVLSALPTLPEPHSVIEVRKETKLTALGKSFVKVSDDKEYAIDILGHSHWEENALTVDEVVEALQKKGFFALRGTVAMALNSARFNGGVRSVRCTKPTGGRGSSYCRYFLAA